MDIRKLKKFHSLDKLPHGLTWYEDPMWYDWIAYYEDKKWNRYSRNGNPIERYEMCKHWYIFEVIIKTEWPWRFDYSFQIMGARPDTIWQYDSRPEVDLKILKYNRYIYNRIH